MKEQTYKIKYYTDVQKNEWDNFVNSSSMGWAYFLYDVIKIHRWSSYVNESFAITDNNDVILMIVQLHRTPDGELTSQWGFALKDNLSRKQYNKLRQFFQDYIDFLIYKYDIKKYTASLPPLSEANLPDKHNVVNKLMFFNFIPNIKYTYIVDLSKNDERMFADCEETTRQAIRKNELSDKYSVVESNGSKEDCSCYIKLHKETYTRTNAASAIIDDDYHKYLFEKLLPQKRCRVFFLKDNDVNEYVSAVIILIYKNTAFYWWGGSKNEKDIGINKYLLFKAICCVRESFGKKGYFETGFAFPYLKTGKNKGLNDYKKSFGTFLYPIFGGVYQSPERKHKTLKILGIKIKYRDKKQDKQCKIFIQDSISKEIKYKY